MSIDEDDASTPRWIDIGANLTSNQFKRDLGEVIARAEAAGVTRMVVTGTDAAGSAEALELASRTPGSGRRPASTPITPASCRRRPSPSSNP